MTERLIECVPNFSEGRRPEVIQTVVEAIQSVTGVHLLDTSSDADHNRTVITFAAAPEDIAKAAFKAIECAAQHIDLEAHSGEHPRIGAADVVPFIPLRGVSMLDCVAIAHDLGQRVANQLKIPVYFYEYAALRPERANLAEVRRHRYERLKSTIATDPTQTPDLGPKQLGPAGAIAIGARPPLIAFNLYLDTDDQTIAQAIAGRIRAANGGLPGIKALGLLVNGQAQVSVNVVNFRQTSLYTLVEQVQQAAKQHNTSITHTELIGLVPQQALIEAALQHLKLPLFTQNLILEQRLGIATGDYQPIDLSFE